MAYPRLPYWFYVGRVSTPIDGPVYVMKGDTGEVAEQLGSAVLTPRMKFFASKQAVSHLVSRGLVKRMKQPEPPMEEVEASEPKETKALLDVKEVPTPAPATKSESASEQPKVDGVSGGSGTGSEEAVVASDAGEVEAGGSSEPEEKETAKPGKRRSRRS